MIWRRSRRRRASWSSASALGQRSRAATRGRLESRTTFQRRERRLRKSRSASTAAGADRRSRRARSRRPAQWPQADDPLQQLIQQNQQQRHRAGVRRRLAHHPDAEGLAADAVARRTSQTTEAAIARYEQIVAAGGWPQVPPIDRLRLGTRIPACVAAAPTRLKLAGDLDPSAVENDVYDSYVEAAVRRFQARHGLSPDGRLARAHLQGAEHPGRRSG